jgi:hypothetical protein
MMPMQSAAARICIGSPLQGDVDWHYVRGGRGSECLRPRLRVGLAPV